MFAGIGGKQDSGNSGIATEGDASDCGGLARLVAEHRLPLDEARETAVDLAYRLPKRAYKL